MQSRLLIHFIHILSRSPEAVCAVTRKVATGEIVGIRVDRDQSGVMVLDPFDGLPVRWQDLDGVPHWRVSRGASTGSYRSGFVSRDSLLAELQCSNVSNAGGNSEPAAIPALRNSGSKPGRKGIAPGSLRPKRSTRK